MASLPHLRSLAILALPLSLVSVSGKTAEEPTPLRIAVYDDRGASGAAKETLIQLLQSTPGIQAQRLKVADIIAGRLREFDVVIHPGGSGGGQGRALGEEGRKQVRSFVEGGGGFVGICAGAYLASRDYPWSLNILDAKVLDKAHWARGSGEVELAVTGRGKQLLGLDMDRRPFQYFQGPLLAPAGDPELDDYEPLATFATEIAEKGAPKGVMIGTTAAAAGRFGKGRVLCFSPHPEKSKENHPLLLKGLRWVAERPR